MTLFALTDEHARMGKIANNLELHGEAESKITGFTLPVELRVPRPQIVGLMGEKFDQAVWEGNGTAIDATPWARRCLPITLTDEVYVGVASQIVLGGTAGKELCFTDSRVSKVELVGFDVGGYTRVKCHLYVRPGIGEENLALQEYQEHEIAVQMTSGKLRVKADKAQQQLPLEERSQAPAPTEGNGSFETIGTPDQEREKAHERERVIAQRLADAHANGDGPDDDDDDEEDDDEMARELEPDVPQMHCGPWDDAT